MLLQKKHKINYLGLSVFIVLFILSVFSFYDILIKYPDKVFHHELASVSSNAVVLNTVQQLSISNNLIPRLDNSSFKVITERIKILTNNRLILQKISTLQLVELSFTDIKPPGFYCHYFSRSGEYVPTSG